MNNEETPDDLKPRIVFNDTDGFPAHEGFLSLKDAVKFREQFPKNYARQGYYRTGRGIAIDPYDVVLTIIYAKDLSIHFSQWLEKQNLQNNEPKQSFD